MAKKKEKIDLNGKPLEAITIGELKSTKNSWIGTIIFFVFFILVIAFLPQLSKLYNMYFGSESTTPKIIHNNTTNIINNTVEENNTEVSLKLYKFNEDTNVTIDNLEFNSIKLSNTTVTFDVIKDSENIDIDDKNLFFETYDKNDELLNRFYLVGTSNKMEEYRFNVSDKSYSYAINKINEEDYTYIDLASDDNNNSVLTCTNANEKYIYTFYDEKLNKVEKIDDVLKANFNYNDKYTEYLNLVTDYKNKEGINVKLLTNENSLNFDMVVDYSIYNNSLKGYFFKKDISPREVNFKMETSSFDCK